jgi:Ca2+-binding EF-hand superfamily protein
VIFRSWVDTICQFKQKREEDKFIEQADLRQVLKKFGVHYINQNLFLNEFTRGPVHIDDLITLMKRCISSMYASGESDIQTTFGYNSLDAVKTTDFFARISKMILKHAKSIDRYALMEKFREFDSADTGLIKASFLVQVLSNNLP